MQSNQLSYDRFKLVMGPAILLGIITNLYITFLLIVLSAEKAISSPVLGSLIFVTCYLLLHYNKISAKLSFLIVAYTVSIEVIVHSIFLGWNGGFYYFIILLPTVFLLNTNWKTWMSIFFFSSIALITASLKLYSSFHPSIYPLKSETLEYINLINLTGSASVIIVIMFYFSRTISDKDKALIHANTELELQNKEILEQHKHLQLLIKEIHHRVKNNLQIISSLMSLQERSVKDKDVIAVLNESKRRVEAIALIHQKLYQNENEYQVDFKSYLEEIMSSQRLINQDVQCDVKSDEIMLDLDTAVPLGLIISEMITNALKHAFHKIEKPELTVYLKQNENNCELIVEDNGIGLPEDFDIKNNDSLGFEIITALADQIDATIEYRNNPGAVFLIQFNKTEI